MKTTLFVHDVAQLYFDLGRINEAIQLLEDTVNSISKVEDSKKYLACIQILLRCYGEKMEFAKIAKIESSIKEQMDQNTFYIDGKTHYIFGLCSSYNGNYEAAIHHCENALKLAINEKNDETIYLAILGKAISFYQLNQIDKSLYEVLYLQSIMGAQHYPQIHSSMCILKAHLLRKQKKYSEALELLSITKNGLNKNIYSYLHVLYGFALIYRDIGKFQEASDYLKISKKSLDNDNLPRFFEAVENLLKLMGEQKTVPDLILRGSERILIEKDKGPIDFNNQFILLDLLKLLMRYPGITFTKEDLAKQIWNENYEPDRHDNKIYVTIRRLRHLIEPDIKKPKYIFRSKDGYYISKDVDLKN